MDIQSNIKPIQWNPNNSIKTAKRHKVQNNRLEPTAVFLYYRIDDTLEISVIGKTAYYHACAGNEGMTCSKQNITLPYRLTATYLFLLCQSTKQKIGPVKIYEKIGSWTFVFELGQHQSFFLVDY